MKVIIVIVVTLASVGITYVTSESFFWSSVAAFIVLALQFLGDLLLKPRLGNKIIKIHFRNIKDSVRDRYKENNLERKVSEIDYFVSNQQTLQNKIIDIYSDFLDFDLQKYYIAECYSSLFSIKETEYDEEYEKILVLHKVVISMSRNQFFGCLNDLSKGISMIKNMEFRNSEFKYEKIKKMIDNLLLIKNEIDIYLNVNDNNMLIITGDAGIGKTNILLDNAKKSLENKTPTIVLLGRTINAKDDFKIIIKKNIYEIDETIKYISSKKGILMIDGINESRYFNDHMDECIELINSFGRIKGLRVLITIRTEYIKHIKDKFDATFYNLEGFTSLEVSSILKSYGLSEKYYYNHILSNPLFLELFLKDFNNEQANEYIVAIDNYLSHRFYEIKSSISKDKVLRNNFTKEMFDRMLTVISGYARIDDICQSIDLDENNIRLLLEEFLEVGLIEKYINKYIVSFDLINGYICVVEKLKSAKSEYDYQDIEPLKLISNIDVRELKYFDISESEIIQLYINNLVYTSNTIDTKFVISSFENSFIKYNTEFSLENHESKYEYFSLLGSLFILQSKRLEIREYLISDILKINNVVRDIKYISLINNYSIDTAYNSSSNGNQNIINYLLTKSEFDEFELLLMVISLGSSNRVIRDNISVKIRNILTQNSHFDKITYYLKRIDDVYIWSRMFEIFKHCIFEGIFSAERILIVEELYNIYLNNNMQSISIVRSYFEICHMTKLKFKINVIPQIDINYANDIDFDNLKRINPIVSESISMNSGITKRTYGDWGRYRVSHYFSDFITSTLSKEECKLKYETVISDENKKKIEIYDSIKRNYFTNHNDVEKVEQYQEPRDFLTPVEYEIYITKNSHKIVNMDNELYFFETIELWDLENLFSKLYYETYGSLNQNILNINGNYGRYDHNFERISKKYQWILFDEILLRCINSFLMTKEILDEEGSTIHKVALTDFEKKIGSTIVDDFSLMFSSEGREKKDIIIPQNLYNKDSLNIKKASELIQLKNKLLMNYESDFDMRRITDSNYSFNPIIADNIEEVLELLPSTAGDLNNALNNALYEENVFYYNDGNLRIPLLSVNRYGESSEYDSRISKMSGPIINTKFLRILNLKYKNEKYYYNDKLIFEYININKDNVNLVCSDVKQLNQMLKKANKKLYFIFVHWYDVYNYGDTKDYITDICTVNILQYKNNKIVNVKELKTNRDENYKFN